MSTATLTDNAQTVSRIYDAFNRADIQFILSNIAEDCQWEASGEGSLLQGGTYRGKDVATFFKRLNDEEQFNSFNPVSVHAISENDVAAFGDLNVTMKATGKKVSSDWAMHWKFNDDGQVIYFKNFFDTAALYLASQKSPATTTEQEEKNIAIVRNAFDNFLKGNIEGIMNDCADDIEWGAHNNPGVPFAKTFYGKEGASNFFSTLLGNIEYTAFEPKEFYADGDKVFVKGYHEAKVKSNGNSFGHSILMEFTFSNSKVSSFFAWVDSRDQAQAFHS